MWKQWFSKFWSLIIVMNNEVTAFFGFPFNKNLSSGNGCYVKEKY